MLINFDDNAAAVKLLDRSRYSLVIIGTGAAGLCLADTLSRAGQKVLLVETGGHKETAWHQKLNSCSVNTSTKSQLFRSVTWGRRRTLGGTTSAWGGQALPFQKLDFENRPWVNQISEWPIDFNDLSPYYKNAERFLGVCGADYYDNTALPPTPSPAHRDLQIHVSKWAKKPNMFLRHRYRITRRCDILYNAHCTAVNHAGCSVTSLQITSRHGHHVEIPVSRLAIAAGGVETTRIMLINGLSPSPLVGRGFMEHPCLQSALITGPGTDGLQYQFAPRFKHGQRYSVRVTLSRAAQCRYRTLNASASIMFNSATGDAATTLYDLARRPTLKQIARFPFRTRSAIPHAFQSLYLLARHGLVYRQHTDCRLLIMAEQEPALDSTLSLHPTQKDVFGQPRICVNWHITDKTLYAVRLLTERTREYLESRYDVEIHVDSSLTNPEGAPATELFQPANHHMGGTVMGKTAETSVVDKNLLVFSKNNLYICSCSVFPTSSHSNPTLTLLALTCRLADHLSRHCPHRPVLRQQG